jgi:hypothetical protein
MPPFARNARWTCMVAGIGTIAALTVETGGFKDGRAGFQERGR